MTETITETIIATEQVAVAQRQRKLVANHAATKLNETIAPEAWFPPLESGDRLKRAEFERRYNARPDLKKAELIEGVVYVASPVRINQHAFPHQRISTWVGVYCAATPGVLAGDNGTLRLDNDNEPQPDVSVWLDEAVGGQAHVDVDDYLAGAPELLIEVAASTAAYDLYEKQRVYRRNGIQEYLVLQVYEQVTTWFRLQDGEYQPLLPDALGILRSQVFPGLWLDSAKFWAGDLAGVLAALQAGIAADEHLTFVAELQHRMTSA